MNKVVIINGSGTSGKDTFVELFERNCKTHNVYNISSVAKVKEASKILGWTGTKTDKDRKFLSTLKKLSELYYNHPNEFMLSQFATFKEPYISFFHIREPEKIQEFKDLIEQRLKVFTILINRDNIQSYSNSADKRVSEFEYDFIIDNNKTLYDLDVKSIKFYKTIIGAK